MLFRFRPTCKSRQPTPLTSGHHSCNFCGQITSENVSIPQECPRRLLHKSPQERLTRVSHKSVLRKCPARVSHRSVLQECLLQECLLQECQKMCGRLFASACLHSGSWVPSCGTLVGHSCRTIVGHSCWTLLLGTLVRHSRMLGDAGRTLFSDTLVGHSCGTL